MMHCPLCQHAAHARSSYYVTATLKERYHQCQNINCGHTFVTHESFVRSIVTPGTINPAEKHIQVGEQAQLFI